MAISLLKYSVWRVREHSNERKREAIDRMQKVKVGVRDCGLTRTQQQIEGV